MDSKYSILLCNQNLTEYENRISKWISLGTRVLWLGKEEEVTLLKDKYSEFAKAFLLQAYATQITEQGICVDGEGEQVLFDKMAEDCPMFNSAQYQVEHCKV